MYWPLRQDHKPANPLFEKLGGEKVKVTGTVYEKNNTKFIVDYVSSDGLKLAP